jgi:hypothetical protein
MLSHEDMQRSIIFSNINEHSFNKKINEDFTDICIEGNTKKLELFINSWYVRYITDDTISYCATIAIRAENVDLLKFIFENFPMIISKGKEEYLSIAVNNNSQKCFNYLYGEKEITSYESMEYASNYSQFLEMEKKYKQYVISVIDACVMAGQRLCDALEKIMQPNNSSACRLAAFDNAPLVRDTLAPEYVRRLKMLPQDILTKAEDGGHYHGLGTTDINHARSVEAWLCSNGDDRNLERFSQGICSAMDATVKRVCNRLQFIKNDIVKHDNLKLR